MAGSLQCCLLPRMLLFNRPFCQLHSEQATCTTLAAPVGESPGRLYFSSWAEDPFFVVLFFLLIGVGSLIPDLIPYFRQPVFDTERFRAEMAPICWLRGTMVVALFLLFSLTKKLITSFRDTDALSRLFDIKTGLAYWSNFTVSRFTGYQNDSYFITLNAVMLLGELPRSLPLPLFGQLCEMECLFPCINSVCCCKRICVLDHYCLSLWDHRLELFRGARLRVPRNAQYPDACLRRYPRI